MSARAQRCSTIAGRELLEEGQELAADADAQEARVAVGRICGEGERVAREVGDDVARGGRGGAGGPRSSAPGPTGGRAGRQDGEAPRARAAEEAEEDGLGAIVGGVAGGDRARARGRRRRRASAS